MKKPLVLILLCFILANHLQAQDSLLAKKANTDTLVSIINRNTKYEGFGVNGETPMGGAFKGVVYRDSRQNQVEKISLNLEKGGTLLYYCQGKQLFKIVYRAKEYYVFSGRFYSADLVPVKDRAEADELLDFERAFQSLLILFP